MTKENIHRELEKRILVLSGATGTMIQSFRLKEEDFRGERFKDHKFLLKGNNDILSLTKPDIIASIQKKFIDAGSDFIDTNTFNANRISQVDYGLEEFVYEINFSSAQAARKVADEASCEPGRQIYVLGSMGPTNKSASMSPNVNDPSARAVSFDELSDAYYEQAEGLVDGGVDLFLVETIFDALNAKAALFAINKLNKDKGIDVPIMVSGTIADKSGRILSGQTLGAFVSSLSHVKLFSIGLNCSFGAKDLKPYIEYLSTHTESYVSVHPNAGLPNQFGEYDETPDFMSCQIKDMLDSNCLNIVGGCCGTTPEHIRAISKLVKGYRPRKKPILKPKTTLSGLEQVIVDKSINNFINIGERTNVAGSRKFARLISEGKYDEALSIARNQVDGGASIIDINMDDAMLDAQKEMLTFIRLVSSEPDIAKVPIMIDSSKWGVIEEALKNTQGKSVVNSISLKEGENDFRFKAEKILAYGASVVVMAFDENGQATTFNRKVDICQRAYNILTDIGFNPYDIIFDVNVLAIGTGIKEHNNYGVDFIEAVRWIKQNLIGVKTSGGISNLSFSFRGNHAIREAMHSVFLYHAIEAGLDMGIVNPGMLQIYDNIDSELLERVEDVVLNKREDATDRLLEVADKVKQSKNNKLPVVNEWRNNDIEERLSYSIVKAVTDFIEEDILEAIDKYKNVIDIIERPLMNGMNRVGSLFGKGKMFLPQVVKSARVMKKAVEILSPYLDKENTEGNSTKSGTIVIATVKGDVHDIGKNIVNIVLSCNHFNVVDLGVMIDNHTIISEALRLNADAIAVSGLITPSLEEMEKLCHELANKRLKIPVFVGGATTSVLHTAVKLAPLYKYGVIYGGDASQTVGLVKSLIKNRKAFIEKKYNEYTEIRNKYENSSSTYYSLDKAREKSLKLDFTNETIKKPNELGIKKLENIKISEIKKYIDWTYFFHAWQIKGIYPDLLSCPERGEEAKKLFDDAQKLLADVIESGEIKASGVLGLFPAASKGDDILVFDAENKTKLLGTFPQLRQQSDKNKHCLCLSDFVAPEETGKTDYVGFFALTAGIGAEKLVEKYKKEHDDYKALLVQTLTDRLAEAFSEMMHERVRKTIWAYSPEENLSRQELIDCKYSGIRPAYGYPACPDHSIKRLIFDLLDVEKETGIKLNESYAMYPCSSTCGMYLAHPDSRCFSVGKITKEQANDYIHRRGKETDKIDAIIKNITGT